MTDNVNTPHLGLATGLLLGRLNRDVAALPGEPVRPSQVRILEAVGPDGARLTDVAAALGMTKQGARQLVAALLDRALLEQRPDPDDRRAKVLVTTEAGRALVADVHRRLDRVERAWEAEIGPADYARFRAVLDRLTLRQRV